MEKTNKTVMNTVWFVESNNSKKGGWIPLWNIDNERIEQCHQINYDSNKILSIRNTHYTVDINSRLLISNYSDEKPKKLIRGTWFYMHTSTSKYIPFEESIADNIEIWFLSILVIISSY